MKRSGRENEGKEAERERERERAMENISLKVFVPNELRKQLCKVR
jgi:hypothetical protein